MKVSPLRQRMLDTLVLRGCSASTIKSYVHAVESLSRYYFRSPELISPEEIQAWLLWLLKQRGVSASTCRQYFNGVRFLYTFVLEDVAFSDYRFTLPKRQQRLPDLLTRQEVQRLIRQPSHPKYRLLLRSAYGCGLRVSELVHIRLSDIDGERQLLHVVQGKGGKDRYVPIPDSLLPQWRAYWQRFRPNFWLFPGRKGQALSITSAQKCFRASKQAADIFKHGGIHSLRHAFATHSLQAGMPIHQLQRILGHSHLSTTSRYTHWLADSPGDSPVVDLVSDLHLDRSCTD